MSALQGSGLSDGEYVTLGAHEVDDLEAVVAHLRGAFPESTIGRWGRSMGAVTALMYSQRDPSIAGVVGPHYTSDYIPGMSSPLRVDYRAVGALEGG